MTNHICCDGECNHDDCCGKIKENCPLLAKKQYHCMNTEHSDKTCPLCEAFPVKSTHQEENTIEGILKDFDIHFPRATYGVNLLEVKYFLSESLHLAEQKGYERGQQDLLDEWNHDQKQLLDGFAHPKDCKMCKKHNILNKMIIQESTKLTSELMNELRKKFKVYSYWSDEELDKDFPVPKEITVREFAETQESTDFKGKSWNEMGKTNMMTFREYIMFFQAYYEKYKKYPDEIGWTVFKDSLSDDWVANGCWSPGSREVGFGWNNSGNRYAYYGARVAISLCDSSAISCSLTDMPPVIKNHEDRLARIEAWINGVKNQLL